VSTPPAPATKSSNERLFLSAFSALHDPTSRAYYDKKRAEKKKHNAALICLARRRCEDHRDTPPMRTDAATARTRIDAGSATWFWLQLERAFHCGGRVRWPGAVDA